jgi:hypothetical protein
MAENEIMREFAISTPSGQRVLVNIGTTDFAMVRDAFEPPSDNSSERLRLSIHESRYPLVVSADGTWINHRQLYAIANGIAWRAKQSVGADRIRDMLFYDGLRPDVATIFRTMYAARHPDDRIYWNRMLCHTRFDADTATFHPIGY